MSIKVSVMTMKPLMATVLITNLALRQRIKWRSNSHNKPLKILTLKKKTKAILYQINQKSKRKAIISKNMDCLIQTLLKMKV